MVLQLARCLAVAVLIVSCKGSPEVLVPAADEQAIVRVDTFKLQSAVTDQVQVRHLADSLAPDSSRVSRFKIVFLQKGTLLRDFAFAIPFDTERGSWSLSQEVFADSLAGIDRRFLILTNGYEACGYPQNSFLFFADDRIELVDRWVSYSDGGLGIWREFFAIFDGSAVTEFRHRTVSSEEVEGPEGEPLIEVTFRDSAIVKPVGGKWLGEFVTLPDVRYRTEVLTVDEYYQ